MTHCAVCDSIMDRPEEWLGMCPACWGLAGLRVAESMAEETAALRIEGYRIMRRIARGGMGTVYEAVREGDGQRVALKIIREDLAENPRFVELFRREGEVLARLDHPHIVRHLGTGEVDGVPFLVMEFIDGPNLQQVLRKKPLSVSRALEIVEQVCAALEAAHAQGMIHRDIKPANVLLDETGQVKVTDFGLAKLPRPAGEAALTGSLLALGGHFTAPELEHGGADPDQRADIYSVGALLYHLITARPPRAGALALHRLRSGPGVTLGLQRIISRTLQSEAARRFASMSVLRRQVVQQRRFITAWPFFAQRRVQLALLMACLLGLLAASLLLWEFVHQPPEFVAAEEGLRAQQLADEAVDARLAILPADWQPQQYENSLGMKFVSIPDCEVMFCIWETRVRDYTAYSMAQNDRGWLDETGYFMALNASFYDLKDGDFIEMKGSWRAPNFSQTEEHPVCGTSLFDAQAFCTWLTWKERRSGGIRADQAYRLPTDAEWSAAAGLKPEHGDSPEAKNATWTVRMHAFPWGHAWPAPDDLFNIVDNAVVDKDWHPNWIFKPRRDPWPRTAPVDAVPASPLGLYHLVGNVAEITESLVSADPKVRLYSIRGGSWMDGSRLGVSLVTRSTDSAGMRISKRGFRVVFQPTGAVGWRYLRK